MSDGPTIRKGRSKQDYGTPDDFWDAVVDRFGEPMLDLAATAENTMCGQYLGPGGLVEDSLSADWGRHNIGGYCWLNPPYDNISPWAARCSVESSQLGTRILMLVPASVGSKWYREFVEPYAYVLGLNPRLTFKGMETPYPKDCILAVYSNGLTGFKTWRWK